MGTEGGWGSQEDKETQAQNKTASSPVAFRRRLNNLGFLPRRLAVPSGQVAELMQG